MEGDVHLEMGLYVQVHSLASSTFLSLSLYSLIHLDLYRSTPLSFIRIRTRAHLVRLMKRRFVRQIINSYRLIQFLMFLAHSLPFTNKFPFGVCAVFALVLFFQ